MPNHPVVSHAELKKVRKRCVAITGRRLTRRIRKVSWLDDETTNCGKRALKTDRRQHMAVRVLASLSEEGVLAIHWTTESLFAGDFTPLRS